MAQSEAVHSPPQDGPSAPHYATGRSVDAATRETLEDYTLRFAPRHYRKWTPAVVGISALGGIAYLADFAIGANIGISYGTTSALWGIAIFAVVVVLTGFPLAYYAARYNLDLDLITRGSGFGYYGSVVTNVIFATFTFIFFALEGAIMAQGLELGLGIPLWLGYALSTVLIFPLVIYGMKVLSKLQLWTTPLWLILMVLPFAYLVISHPESVGAFFEYRGEDDQSASVGSALLAAGVCLSLIAQIAEQIDYLRFMPPRTPENARKWWTWMVLAGPGWVLFGAAKQVIGLFLAVYIIANISDGATIANQPVHQFLEIYSDIMPGWLALTLAVVLVVISQVKINVTNAYSGSLAWTNSYTRVTRHYPGRLVFLGINLVIALVLMEANMFDFLNTILGFYANCGIAWIVVVASDIAINKYLLKISPKEPEFRRGMLYAVNPVGFGSMLISAGVSILVFFGGLGEGLKPYSPLVAIVLALVFPPILAIATKGRWYLRRVDDGIDAPMNDELGNPSGETMTCHVCRQDYERPDMAACQTHGAHICSLCLSTDRTGEHVLPEQPVPWSQPVTTARSTR
ncbi:MAG TPA: allantoin permease [Streptomyces sp.]|uniref:purine-cytosine permease family protein n=1 Tax=Streptomyces sp. TaxID=1931 RepID=UPI002BC7A939|nr:allantoin permease [Streptomyces sp.]HWU08440.1 allantoin permease [Streptomyces sp.]